MSATGFSAGPRPLLWTVYFIYFFCGLTLCFEGAFNPEIKEHFQLGYQEQMYTMFAKNIPFALALGIGFLIPHVGYKNCLTLGMTLFGLGTLLLAPGLASGSYATVLAAFFIIGLGFNFQLVAGNPMLSALGPADGSASRLNLGNALGAVAQILGPLTLTLVIPPSVVTVQGKLPYMKALFLIIGVLLLGIALLTLMLRHRENALGLPAELSGGPSPATGAASWLQPRLVFGFVTIFVVLGAEAGLFGLYRNFVEDRGMGGLTSHASQRMFTVYFATYALGRLIGAAVQKRVRPAVTLVVAAVAALLLLVLVTTAQGMLALVAVTALGFFVSIFFPTLYALAIDGLGERTAQASGLLTMGFLGCAVLPVVQGWLADRPGVGLQRSYALWFFAYAGVLLYVFKCCGPLRVSRRP